MPAPRNCRSCGTVLPGTVRWCGQCYAPVTEFAARAPLHDGDFVGSPIHVGGHVPHWSRTEKSATTLSLTGRIVLTTLFFVGVLMAGAFGYFIYVIASPVVGFMFLSAIWQRGWVVPDEPTLDPLPVQERPEERRKLTPAMWIWRVTWMALVLAAVLLIAYGSDEVMFGVLCTGTLAGMWWFWREFLGD